MKSDWITKACLLINFTFFVAGLITLHLGWVVMNGGAVSFIVWSTYSSQKQIKELEEYLKQLKEFNV